MNSAPTIGIKYEKLRFKTAQPKSCFFCCTSLHVKNMHHPYYLASDENNRRMYKLGGGHV